MKKLIINFGIFLCLSSFSIYSQSILENILGTLFYTKNNLQEEDYQACGRLSDQELEFLFQPGIQPTNLKGDLNKFINKTRQAILNELRNKKYLTLEKAKGLTKDLARARAIDYLVEKAAAIASKKLQHPPINPSLFDKKTIIERIKNDIRNIAIAMLEKRDGRLTELMLNLHKVVVERLNFYFDQLRQPSSTPSMSHSSDDEIYEVYPRVTGDRNKEFFKESAIEKRKNLRDEEKDCPVCFEPFADLKARVNLFCGHFVCPQCIYKQMYTYYQSTCPLCRTEIREDEFPASELKKHF